MTSAIKRALTAATAQWAKMGEPSPVGKLIMSHKHANVKLVNYVWHAGPQSKLIDQIAKGKFDKIGMDIYFGNPSVAAHFGGREKDSVILNIAGTEKASIDVNDVFHTTYFVSGEDQDVYIIGAYEINPEWTEYVSNVKNQPTTAEKTTAAFQAFKNEFFKE